MNSCCQQVGLIGDPHEVERHRVWHLSGGTEAFDAADRVSIARLLVWAKDPNRKPPHLAFTAGAERIVADIIDAAVAREREEILARLEADGWFSAADTIRARSGALCEKAAHDNPSGGYLHGENDDGPYDVDGVSYCGRCHGLAHRSGAHEPWVEHEHPFKCSLCGVELAKHARSGAKGG